jgi:hypothetical protein
MTARSWTLRLAYPKLPLSLNDRRHHMVRHRAAKTLRDRVRMLARAEGIPRLDGLHVEMHWTPATNRTRDADNAVATLKAAIDGLRDYPARYRTVPVPAGVGRGGVEYEPRRVLSSPAWVGIVPDDDPAHVTWSRPIIHPADPELTQRLVLVITEGTRPE